MKNPYPGTRLYSGHNYFETRVSFDRISNDPKILNIQKPVEQGSLNDDKVNEMIDEYQVYPTYLRFKNKIVIGDYNNTWYIIDGQHRVEMVRKLYEQNNELVDDLLFCWYKCTDETCLRYLFNSINKDSNKNQFYIQQGELEQIKINEFMKYLKLYYAYSFATRKTEKGYIKTIEEVRDELIQIHFFDNDLTYKELFDNFIEKNNEFYEINRYEINKQMNMSSFYTSEIKHIDRKIIFSLKKNNFIKWLQDPINIEPNHRFKKGRKKITRDIKLACWVKEFNNEIQGCCPVKNCSIILNKNKIKEWAGGHIISDNNGGENIVDNLRPICHSCNASMNSTNWEDYINQLT